MKNEETKLIAHYPNPVTEEHVATLSKRIRARYARKRRMATILRAAASLVLITGLAALIQVHVAQAPWNGSRAEVRLDPIDFEIARTDGHVRLEWDTEEGVDYIVKKCTIRPSGLDCIDEATVHGGAFEEPATGSIPLVLYRVFVRRT